MIHKLTQTFSNIPLNDYRQQNVTQRLLSPFNGNFGNIPLQSQTHSIALVFTNIITSIKSIIIFRINNDDVTCMPFKNLRCSSVTVKNFKFITVACYNSILLFISKKLDIHYFIIVAYILKQEELYQYLPAVNKNNHYTVVYSTAMHI